MTYGVMPLGLISAIGSAGEVETVFKLLEHAAANADHPIKKFRLILPFVRGINKVSKLCSARIPVYRQAGSPDLFFSIAT